MPLVAVEEKPGLCELLLDARSSEVVGSRTSVLWRAAFGVLLRYLPARALGWRAERPCCERVTFLEDSIMRLFSSQSRVVTRAELKQLLEYLKGRQCYGCGLSYENHSYAGQLWYEFAEDANNE